MNREFVGVMKDSAQDQSASGASHDDGKSKEELSKLLSLKEQTRGVPSEKRYLTDYSRKLYRVFSTLRDLEAKLRSEERSPLRGGAHSNSEDAIAKLRSTIETESARVQAIMDSLGENRKTIEDESLKRSLDTMLDDMEKAKERLFELKKDLKKLDGLADDYMAPNDVAYKETTAMKRKAISYAEERVKTWLSEAESSISGELRGEPRKEPSGSPW